MIIIKKFIVHNFILFTFFFSFELNGPTFHPLYVPKVSENAILIDQKVQVNDDFFWKFLPLYHYTSRGDWGLGYFFPTDAYKASSGKEFHRIDKIELTRYTLYEETLLEKVETDFRDFYKAGGDEPLLLLLDGNAQIDSVVRLDLGLYNHWLYLQKGEFVYRFYGNVDEDVWQRFMDALTIKGFLEIDGTKVWEDIHQLSVDYEERGTVKKCFCYNNEVYYIDNDTEILSYEHDSDGFEMNLLDRDKYDDTKEYLSTFSISATDALPTYETEEEMLAYFQEKYPKMNGYQVYPTDFSLIYEENEQIFDDVFRCIDVENCRYGYYSKDQKIYEVVCESELDSYSKISTVRRNAGYDYEEVFYWKQYENESISYGNLVEENYYLEKDIGVGRSFVFYAERDKLKEAESEWGEEIFRIEVSEKGADEPFQIIYESSTERMPFSFEDFNADGYQDLFVSYFYGANGGTASHYMWSPSTWQFIRASEELDYYGSYSIDPDTRRLYMHYHGSAISGTETTFQWSNEVDYKMIKRFVHDDIWAEEEDEEDGIEISITQYSEGKEQVLTQYFYTFEEYETRAKYLWGSYYADFVWEKEVTNSATGEKYILRYAKDFNYDENGEKISDSWKDELYIYGEDTQIINCLENESKAVYKQILWQDQNGDGEKELLIEYEDNTRIMYTWEQLLGENDTP